ncbi:McrC family protein [Nocardia blacklockiae]|uniref:McrC family protein n=1 Tax=Nocardia blacklockiae TaxID=480036 RepID=UPI001893D605|nr:restriction endonuclease [Nocardia blacklockiae]MBF6169840.1 restriction endonuclease [Nocardia blacklockiae]
MIDVALTEYAAPLSRALSDAAGRALARSGVVEATPDPEIPGNWRLRAKSVVGVASVPVSDGEAISLRIAPKMPVARLLFLLGYSRNPKGWRGEHVRVDEERDLLPTFARLFARQAEHALHRGLLKGYRETDETALVIRGRVRNAEQVRRHYGRLIPLEITHNEYTIDIAENRLLRTADDTLLRLPGIPTDVRRTLLRLRGRLADVTPISRGTPLPTWNPSRLNARYLEALHLAGLVLRGTSVEHRPGQVAVHGFLFDLAKVFEDFVTVALRDALADRGGHSVLQATHHLDERNAIRMVPDFVYYAADGTPLAVADAKYKAEKPAGFPDADLYQMLAYCTALNLPEGHLVYARGNVPRRAHRIKHTGVVIHQHVLDLEQPPTGLLHDIRAVADTLVKR